MIYRIHHKEIRDNPWQTRLDYDEEAIEALAEDIRRVGLLQPPVGRLMRCSSGEQLPLPLPLPQPQDAAWHMTDDHVVELACGHKRVRAWRLLHGRGEKEPYVLVDLRALSDDAMAQIAWSENATRSDITAWEQVQALRARTEDLGWTHEQCAEKLGLARSTVTSKLRLLRLPRAAQAALRDGEISERQAMALVAVYGEDELLLKMIRKTSGTTPEKLLRDARHGLSSEEIHRRWDAFRNLAKERLAAKNDQPSETDQVAAARQQTAEEKARKREARTREVDGKLAAWMHGGCPQAGAILLSRVLAEGVVLGIPAETDAMLGVYRADALRSLLAAIMDYDSSPAVCAAIAQGMEEHMTSTQIVACLALAIVGWQLVEYARYDWYVLDRVIADALGVDVGAQTSEVES